MIEGLLWCLAALAGQLWLLHYVDRRVAAMPRLPRESQRVVADLAAADAPPDEPSSPV